MHVADEAGAAVVRASHEGGAPQDCASSGQGAYQCPFEEVAGAFTVTAEKDGFTSDSADVDVEEDECHVTPARVDLVLSPTG